MITIPSCFVGFFQSFHLNICYYHQDLHQQRFDPGLRQRLHHHHCALLVIGALLLPQRQSMGATLERHPFSGPTKIKK